MAPDVELTSPAEAEWVASQRKWRPGYLRRAMESGARGFVVRAADERGWL